MILRNFLKRSKIIRWTFLFLGSLLIAGFMIVGWILWWPNSFHEPSERVVYVARGATFQTAMDLLVNAGIVRARWSFKITAAILGGTREVKYGKYVFPSGKSNATILRELVSGSARKLIPVTIPEGMRMNSIANRFSKALGINAELISALCSDSSFISKLEMNTKNLEGYLLPDTYHFHWNTEELEVITRIIGTFKRFYNDSLLHKQAEYRMNTRQILTLASIVEAETQLDEERAIVAGVYHNRLKRRMRLEADPTIQYLISDGPRRVLYRDLRIPSPYNTYLHFGLPPGPINNPGRRSILATLYPAEHSYLFFVADGKGGHKFSKTYADHLRAAREFRRVRREQTRNENASSEKSATRTQR